MSKRALLVIDVQQDFLPGGVIGSKDKGIVPLISELLDRQRFDFTIATQDWHPKVN